LRSVALAFDFVSLAEKIDQVAARTTPGIEDAASGSGTASQDLVEKVDVYLPKLFLKIRHRFLWMLGNDRNACNWVDLHPLVMVRVLHVGANDADVGTDWWNV